MDLKEIIIKCDNCKTTLVWPLNDFKFNLIGAIQMECRKCGGIAGIQPLRTHILGLKDEGQEELINRLLSKEDEPPKTNTTK